MPAHYRPALEFSIKITYSNYLYSCVRHEVMCCRFASQLDIPHEDLLICYVFQALILVTFI